LSRGKTPDFFRNTPFFNGGNTLARKDDYIPISDLDLRAWMSNFLDVLGANLDTFGLTPEAIVPLEADGTEYGLAVGEHLTKQDEAHAATAKKNTVRATLERDVRPLVKWINQHPNMTNELRGALGLNQYKDGRTRRGIGDEAPGLFLETTSGMVIVHFGTSPANEQRNGKPEWARGCNIYRRKSSEDAFQLVVCAASSPYVDEISDEAAVLTYVAAYVGKRSNRIGPGSHEITVAAGGVLLKKAA
jgi:hypothetical protein